MKKHIKKIMLCLLLTICCLCGALISTTNNIVYAVNNAIEYTNVLYDLQTDENFDASDYVIDNTDYSLQVIQIAESNNKELFVYVYQPCSPNEDLQATSINISKGIGANLSYRNYALTLLNSNNTLYKYKVNGFEIEQTQTRYYDIKSIFRNWYEEYDESLPIYSDNVINEVVFAVNRCYVVKTINNKVTYTCTETEDIQIESKHVGFVRYLGGTNFFGSTDNLDSHYIAFSTNKLIDNLIEADIYYQYQSVSHNLAYPDHLAYSFGEIYNNYSYITEEDIIYYQGNEHFWNNYSYEKERIQSIDDFIDSEDFTKVYKCAIFNSTTTYQLDENAIEDLQDKQWVLRFCETTFYHEVGYMPGPHGETGLDYYTNVSNVSILRLKFDANGTTYNLGVIDNKQSGNDISDNIQTTIIRLNDPIKFFLALILFIILLVLLAPFLPAIFNFIIWLFKGIWQVITAPFKSIKHYKDKKKKGGGKK